MKSSENLHDSPKSLPNSRKSEGACAGVEFHSDIPLIEANERPLDAPPSTQPLPSQHRIDSPHALRVRQSQRTQHSDQRPTISKASPESNNEQSGSDAVSESQLSSLRTCQLHLEDLAAQLQHRLAEIDARESQLHTKIALHDIEQRNFRNWKNSQLAILSERMRDLDRRERELTITAQRLAAAEWANEQS